MPPALTLLDGVAWRGRAVAGDRVAALLAALAARPAGVGDGGLIDQIWADDAPAAPTKALQVLVSRARSALGHDSVERYDGGYRLGVPADEVDAWVLRTLTREAQSALAAGDAATAVDRAGRAVALGTRGEAGDGPLGDLRRRAGHDLDRAGRVLGLALAASGRDAEALPLLGAAHRRSADDVAVLDALLRAEAATAGTASALERYERYRSDLADRLGVDPEAALQRLHRELLAADTPVRDGVRFDADTLLGRDEDLATLRTAVRRGRLVSIVGPGGLGKTRVAHVLAREAIQPRVYVVELVGVTSADDVVAEVGTVLGVRGSMTARRTLSPAQLADVRSRIATELDTAPTLLVLDNCEHVLESVASLVALLLVTTRDLRVLTTSRAPLGLAAEQVVALRQLADRDAAELFVRRAGAARADADADPALVADIVARLDGLPLAIELAAARVRTMSVEEVRRRLDDRFALLRSRDRSAPERHRTLTAVIQWSWDLLDALAQEAMARLSVFHDGFTRDVATAVLGHDGADLVETLAEQSLVVVADTAGVTRFRMLETVREFAAAELVTAGLRDDAYRQQNVWAVATVGRHAGRLFAIDGQIDAIDALHAEENNLADVLRRALRDGDPAVVASTLSALGVLWTITGNHPRIFAVADAAEAALTDWDPPPELVGRAQESAAWLVVHLSWLPGRQLDALTATLRRWGRPEHPWARVCYAMFVESDALGTDTVQVVAAIADETDVDPVTAQMALLWASLIVENTGDVATAARYARAGLLRPPLTPYLEATLHGRLAQLSMAQGDYRTAAGHAAVAWPLVRRLHADDDARSMRIAVALAPLVEGDIDACERILDEIGDDLEHGLFGSLMVLVAARAEVALARGEVEEGLRLFDEALARVRPIDGLTGSASPLTPWVLLAASASLVARIRHGRTSADATRAHELRDLLVERSGSAVAGDLPYQDLPLNGVLLVGLAAHLLRFEGPEGTDDGLRLLAIAERWAYNRTLPVLAWAGLADLAETVARGRLAAVRAEYAERTPTDLAVDVRALLLRLTSSG